MNYDELLDQIKTLLKRFADGNLDITFPNNKENFKEFENTLIFILASKENKIRLDLQEATNSFENTINSLVKLYINSTDRLNKLLRKQGALLRVSDALNKTIKLTNIYVEQLTITLKSIEVLRRKELKNITSKSARLNTSPSWEVKHHYHMTAIEHHMGRRQEALFDVAELLRGGLSRCCMAKNLIVSISNISFEIAKKRNEMQKRASDLALVNSLIAPIRDEINSTRSMHYSLSDRLKSMNKYSIFLSYLNNYNSVNSTPKNKQKNVSNTVSNNFRKSYIQKLFPSTPTPQSPNRNNFSFPASPIINDNNNIPLSEKQNLLIQDHSESMTCNLETEQFNSLFQQIDEYSNKKQTYWELLEQILDAREMIKNDLLLLKDVLP